MRAVKGPFIDNSKRDTLIQSSFGARNVLVATTLVSILMLLASVVRHRRANMYHLAREDSRRAFLKKAELSRLRHELLAKELLEAEMEKHKGSAMSFGDGHYNAQMYQERGCVNVYVPSFADLITTDAYEFVGGGRKILGCHLTYDIAKEQRRSDAIVDEACRRELQLPLRHWVNKEHTRYILFKDTRKTKVAYETSRGDEPEYEPVPLDPSALRLAF